MDDMGSKSEDSLINRMQKFANKFNVNCLTSVYGIKNPAIVVVNLKICQNNSRMVNRRSIL